MSEDTEYADDDDVDCGEAEWTAQDHGRHPEDCRGCHREDAPLHRYAPIEDPRASGGNLRRFWLNDEHRKAQCIVCQTHGHMDPNEAPVS